MEKVSADPRPPGMVPQMSPIRFHHALPAVLRGGTLRRLFATLACLLLLAATEAPAEDDAAAAPRRPNLLFLLVDDLRWNVPGFMGDPVAKTPHLDSLAAAGVVFHHSFVTTSICAVSRASILTGQWMRRHGVRDFATGLTPDQWRNTYPALLRAHGYRTGFIGKFGVGRAAAIAEAVKEFDFWRGEMGQGSPDFINPKDPSRTHQTARFGNEALEFLESCPPDQPFCLSISFTAVHARDGQPREFQPDDRDAQLYADTTIPLPRTATEEAFQKIPAFVKTSEGRVRWQRRFHTPEKAQEIARDYYRLLTGVDREVGRLREELGRRGWAENTVIMVTSDNGFALGDRGLADKWFMWEEDIRVPSVIFDPRLPRKKRGRSVPQITLNVDFAPTLLELAGVPPPATMQGRSLAPLLRGETPAGWRTDFFYEHVTLPDMIPPCEGVRTERWKYIRWTASSPLVEELYDLEADPLEETNLAGDPDQTAHLTNLRAETDRQSAALR